MSDITDFISAALDDKPLAAQQAFDNAMADRLDAVVAQQYHSIASNVFNPDSNVTEDDNEYIELESEEQIQDTEYSNE
jgi:hypothetical protein